MENNFYYETASPNELREGEIAVPRVYKATQKGDVEPEWYYGEYVVRHNRKRETGEFLVAGTLHRATTEEIRQYGHKDGESSR